VRKSVKGGHRTRARRIVGFLDNRAARVNAKQW
jgi:hypothetical protein